MELKCSGCKKTMIPVEKNCINNEKVFYKTCQSCRKKQQMRYFKLKNTLNGVEVPQAVDEIPQALVKAPQIIQNKECYICFNEYGKGNTGVACHQCNKSCCGNCYMKIFMSTRGNFKCGLCRFQDFNYQPNFSQKTFAGLVIGHAYICGFDRHKITEFFNIILNEGK